MGNAYKYYLTPLARQDIDDTLNYISTVLCNAKAASDLLDKLEQAIESILAFPFASLDCKNFLIADEKIRHVFVDNHSLIFEVKEAEKQINILRFRFCKIDFTKLEVK